MGDFLAELKRIQDEVADLPEPLAYIVLDHTVALSDKPVPEHDGHGKKYLRISPAILDAMKNKRVEREFHPLHGSVADFTGIPIYKREDMPEGWPDT